MVGAVVKADPGANRRILWPVGHSKTTHGGEVGQRRAEKEPADLDVANAFASLSEVAVGDLDVADEVHISRLGERTVNQRFQFLADGVRR